MTASAINMQVYTQTNWSPTAYPARVHTANRTSYDSFGVVPFASDDLAVTIMVSVMARTRNVCGSPVGIPNVLAMDPSTP
jgi:hypothetical protein